ncbi:MAG: hypothetical protein Q8R18_05645 [bacterium]|nr:hypothetical protein [bacterium]
MIPGYNAPRASAKQYEDFLEILVKGLSGLQDEDISFMIYGSYAGGRAQHGRSDIDACLLVPGEVVTNKSVLDAAALVVASAQRDNTIPFQVAVSDWILFADERFSPYMHNFKEYFEQGRVLVGRDPRETLTKETYRDEVFVSLAFNLRKARTGILLSYYHEEQDYEKLVKDFQKIIDSSLRAGTQLLRMRDGIARSEKFSGMNINDIYQVNISCLEEVRWLYKDLSRLDEIYLKPERMRNMMVRSTTCFETMIQEYRKEYPEK